MTPIFKDSYIAVPWGAWIHVWYKHIALVPDIIIIRKQRQKEL